MKEQFKYFPLCLLACMLACESSSGPDGSSARQIVYTAEFADQNFGLARLDEDGTHFARLTPDSIDAFGPITVSPNGRSMLFDVSYGTSSVKDIWILSKDDGNARPFITHTSFDFKGVWDFTGDRVFFLSNRSGRFSIWTCTAQGTTIQQLISDSMEVSGCVPSPTSTFVAFVHYGTVSHASNGRLALFNYRTGAMKLITSDSIDIISSRLSWSPDGSSISFVAMHPPVPPSQFYSQNLYVVDTLGTSLTQLTHGPVVYSPEWSPDGRTIAFATPSDVQVVNLLTNNSSVAVTFSWDGRVPTARWSSDGASLAYALGEPSFIWIVKVGETTPRRLTQSSTQEYEPVWTSSW